ncbi:PEP-CTERM sorting domain-containing protein [bacterium]|nr:MAG: PEP-CTERM sorting domain-containing protein [bacterium]
MNRAASLVANLSLLVLPTVTSAASIIPIDSLPSGNGYSTPHGVSNDGTAVVGSSNRSAIGYEAFRWTKDKGTVGLGFLVGKNRIDAFGTSENGSIAVGWSSSSSGGYEAFRWSEHSGMTGLGFLAQGVASYAHGVSSNGEVIVGFSESTNGKEAFSWTEAGGMIGLGDLQGGTVYSEATGVSGDGSVVVGSSDSSNGTEAFRWTASQGMIGLGAFPNEDGLRSTATGVSKNGQVVIGYSRSETSSSEAFRWTEWEGLVALGTLPNWPSSSYALGTSHDGSAIVGMSFYESTNQAFLWTKGSGMRSLEDVLREQGTDLTGWSALREATAISSNGRFVVGFGSYNGQESKAFIAELEAVPEPMSLAALALGVAVVVRRRRR